MIAENVLEFESQIRDRGALVTSRIAGEDFDSDDDISIFGIAASASSISTSYYAESYELVPTFVSVLTQDAEFHELISFTIKNVQRDKLHRFLRRLLKNYAANLNISAVTATTRNLTRLLRQPRYLNRIVAQLMSSAHQKPTRTEVIDQIEFELLENDSISKATLYHLDNDTTAIAESVLNFLVDGTPFTNLKSNFKRILCPELERGTIVSTADASHLYLLVSREKTNGVWIYMQRGCVRIIFISFTFIALSVFLGVYFTVSKDYGYSMGDAFTLASYVIGLGTLVCGALIGHHYPHCRCWNKDLPRTHQV
ncbi:hypothetical protein SBOR_4519 [Sclerotinia borealis F-4128]|uniref:Uncharacterized protein n=1 Tax=Sclerotinia borealis (strain F-4128) TaxID=1432307 RepID=W9CK67_SCLBF|nr:hypothetical protein SBOR_4519 [Sclerotinia borealis F-4128]